MGVKSLDARDKSLYAPNRPCRGPIYVGQTVRMLFQGLGKARKESDHNTPISGSLPAADLAMAVLTIAVIATLGVLLVVRVLDPQSIPGPDEMAMLGFVVIGTLFLVRYSANHRK